MFLSRISFLIRLDLIWLGILPFLFMFDFVRLSTSLLAQAAGCGCHAFLLFWPALPSLTFYLCNFFPPLCFSHKTHCRAMEEQKKELAQKFDYTKAVRAGDTLPDFTMETTEKGNTVRLYELLEEQPLVIAYIRGDWYFPSSSSSWLSSFVGFALLLTALPLLPLPPTGAGSAIMSSGTSKST
jgi:hypothetical protein